MSTSQAPAALVPQDLRHSPLQGQIQISVQASSILTACRRALPGQGAQQSPARGNAARPALASWEGASVGEKWLHVELGGCRGSGMGLRCPSYLTGVRCCTSPTPCPGSCWSLPAMESRQCCHLCIPVITFGKGAWVGSWRGPGLGPGLCRDCSPAPAAATRGFVPRLQGPRTESSKCYI